MEGRMVMAILDVYMNGYLIGAFTKSANGSHLFKYEPQWLETPDSRPISLSMPLQRKTYKGDQVYNFFDNLLPDNIEIRNRIVARHDAQSTQAFDLLAKIGQDSVGALQLIVHKQAVPDVKKIESKPLSNKALEKILKGYESNIPLGMLKGEEDFRITLAGAQEKTALLSLQGQWHLPLKNTPTTHIMKLPIGEIKSHSHTIDMTDSVENEYLCMMIVREFGLDVPQCSIIKVGDIKALAVERFDRKHSSDGTWIMRLPQEDFCQTLNVPSAKKYESHGGPSIKKIMDHLLGSMNSQKDRFDFMKSQLLFWLLAATDGHAKNFSLLIHAGGAYRLTPFYDILSIYPVVGGKGLNIRDAKLAMGLKAKKGKKYLINNILPRHFLDTAKDVGFDTEMMVNIMTQVVNDLDSVMTRVEGQLKKDFPKHIKDAIFKGMKNKAKRLVDYKTQ
jgi:serine/threonine-protein kinase HipA